ncbi:MAG: hypothetical protein ABRQ26_01740 [Syntrophomonadaceae bacterium]
MKKILIYIILFMILCTAGGFVLDSARVQCVDEIPPYCLSFASIGAIFQESRLDAWAKIDTGTQKEAEIHKIKRSLGIEDAVWTEKATDKSSKYLFLQGDNSYLITWEQYTPEQEFLRISIKSSDPNANLPQYEKRITGLAGYSWNINYTISGEIGAIVDDQSMPILMDTLVKNLKGRQINNYHYGDSWSATATCYKKPVILDYYHFESALRREKQLGKTRVWLGVPEIQNCY